MALLKQVLPLASSDKKSGRPWRLPLYPTPEAHIADLAAARSDVAKGGEAAADNTRGRGAIAEQVKV